QWARLCFVLVLTCSCRAHGEPRAAIAGGTQASPTSADALAAHPELPPAERALVIVNGAERWVAANDAVAAGYTLVDFGDEWTPFIFQEVTDPSGNVMANRYRQVYLGLANDLGDRDGQPLVEGDHNYLELYGVPPTISVLRARRLDSQARQPACADVDSAKLKAATSIPPRAGKAQQKFEKKVEDTA